MAASLWVSNFYEPDLGFSCNHLYSIVPGFFSYITLEREPINIHHLVAFQITVYILSVVLGLAVDFYAFVDINYIWTVT